MKINKNSQKKLLITLIFVAVVTGLSAAAIIFILNRQATPSIDSPVENTSNKQVDDPKRTPGTQADTINNGNTPPADNDRTYIAPPINQPSTSARYPIENERYRIEQMDTQSFNVTLYPIVNNPAIDNYEQQLKEYKQDVVTYLTDRYGDISSFDITWTPSNAENIQ